MKRILDHDPLTGITDWFEDLGGDGFAVHSSQDVEPFLKRNKAMQNEGRSHWKGQGDFRLEASIPIGVQYEWLARYGIQVWNPEHLPDVVKRLNDPDWRYLKCAEVII